MAVGCGRLKEPDGVARALQVLHDYLAPDALGAGFLGVVPISRLERSTQTIDE